MTGQERDANAAHAPVTIRTCRDVHEALIVRSILHAGGVRAFIPDEHTAGLMVPNVTGGVRVQVPARDVRLARELLSTEEKGMV
jgi:hypothetical protein